MGRWYCMDENLRLRIASIRKFNRFYTNILGLLDRYILNSTFSISEIRILYEIGQCKQCTAKDLVSAINIDPGYLSRMLAGFEKQGFLSRKQSQTDGRYYHLSLTEKGEEILFDMSTQSDQQVMSLLKNIPLDQQNTLVSNMASIESILTRDTAQ